MEWSKFHRKDTLVGNIAASRLPTRKALTLMQGAPVFFGYTTSSAKNATIVAHCQKEIPDPVTKKMVTEKAVWMLDRQDTGGVRDTHWVKVSDSALSSRWSTPACHSAGGGDSVIVVEDGWLVTKSLSRWKRNSDMTPSSKKLMKVRGQVHFLVSPDNSRAVVMQEEVSEGFHSLTVIEGESALDPCDQDTGKIYEVPSTKLAISFWFSPDSTKLLCLTVPGRTKDDLIAQKTNFRVGLNSELQWVVYNFPLEELRDYDTFKPTPYFMKTYVPFFTQYAQVNILVNVIFKIFLFN
jgi:hypothetical protein